MSSKKKSKHVGICLSCGERLKAKDRTCPSCGRHAPLYEGKGVRLVSVAKNGKRKAIRWGCPCGRLNKAAFKSCVKCGSRAGTGWDCIGCGRVNKGRSGFCTGCGERKGTTRDQRLAKSAPGAGTFLAKSAMANPNPGERVRALAAIDREALARGTALSWVAKARGYRDMADAAANSHDAAERELFRRALYDPNGAA